MFLFCKTLSASKLPQDLDSISFSTDIFITLLWAPRSYSASLQGIIGASCACSLLSPSLPKVFCDVCGLLRTPVKRSVKATRHSQLLTATRHFPNQKKQVQSMVVIAAPVLFRTSLWQLCQMSLFEEHEGADQVRFQDCFVIIKG